MALSFLRIFKSLAPYNQPIYHSKRFHISTLNFRPQNISRTIRSCISSPRPPLNLLRRYASTAKVEQMFAAVKINEYKDKALKAGLTDDILADEDALVDILEKAGVPGGFAMKARAWARRNAPKPEKPSEAAGAPPAAAPPPPPPPTTVVLEAIEKTKLGEYKDAILKTGLSDYTIYNEEEFEKALEKAGVGGGMIMKARAWHRRNLAGKTPPTRPAPGAASAASAEIPEVPLPEDEYPPIMHPREAAVQATRRVVGMADAFVTGAVKYYERQRTTPAPKPTASSTVHREMLAVLSEEAASKSSVASARLLLLMFLLYLIFSNQYVQDLLRTLDDIPLVSAVVSKMAKGSADREMVATRKRLSRLDAMQTEVMLLSGLRRRHAREKPQLLPLTLRCLPKTEREVNTS